MVEGWLQSLVPWGARVIEHVQTLSTPALDAFFVAITLLGQEPFYLLLIPVVFWCVDKGHGLRLALVLLATTYLNLLLKGTVMEPRPFLVNPDIDAKLVYTGYSFPSGHAQSSATLWPLMAWHVRRRWFTVLAVAMVLLISFSRVYLGVHYPHDVLAGLCIGLALAAAYILAEARLRVWVSPRHVLPLSLLGLAVSAVLLTVYVEQDVRSVAAALVGASAGFIIEERTLNVAPRRRARYCLARSAIGLPLLGVALVLALTPLPLALPLLQEAIRLLLFAGIGIGFSLGLPLLFVRVGLAERRQPSEPNP